MTATIGPARDLELKRLAEIERAAGRLFPPHRIPDPEATVPTALLRNSFAAGLLLVATQPDEHDRSRVVGFAVCEAEDEDSVAYVHLHEVSVDPHYGRRGIGRGLVQAVLSLARARAALVSLTTFDDIPWNRPFYERLGFRVLTPGETPGFLAKALAEEQRAGLTRRVAMLASGRP